MLIFWEELAEDLGETNLVSKQLDLMQELMGWERSREDSSHISPDVTMLDLFGKEPLHLDPIPCLLQKRDHLNRICIFQPLIFRGHVSFRGSITSLQIKSGGGVASL